MLKRNKKGQFVKAAKTGSRKTGKGKAKRAAAKKIYQIGSSNLKADRRVKAKRPGKRVPASGIVYFERRRNRSDKPKTRL